MNAPINIADKFTRFSDHWSPKVIAQVNYIDIRAVKVQGDFVWHKHDETDEMFLVIEGCFTLEFRDGSVTLNAGDLYVVPKGIEHRPVARDECQFLTFSQEATVNTGDAGGNLTAQREWI